MLIIMHQPITLILLLLVLTASQDCGSAANPSDLIQTGKNQSTQAMWMSTHLVLLILGNTPSLSLSTPMPLQHPGSPLQPVTIP